MIIEFMGRTAFLVFIGTGEPSKTLPKKGTFAKIMAENVVHILQW